MKLALITSAAAGTTVLFASLLIAAPAQAAPGACNAGQGCTYEDINYGRGHINFNYNVSHYGSIAYWVPTLHLGTDNAASSAFNNGRTGQAIVVYDRSGYKGKSASIARGSGLSNLGSRGLNDMVTSACFSSYCK
ncbi:hypothetical protein GCM10025867_27320 [Frondihabitans sucicola]|uniref:Peptidase inhibitor family I36 n=1 Tax=Frondihabitans sucicola TaxID=1268041 RepID=A0ABM8GQD1_9MICO|nr:peptidase inhibitor family I36 protein [Frondihabitans sucicola]BDZ50491.1 hypothetical protein GCM10025867_27320 [Frondihabitans sucicola]